MAEPKNLYVCRLNGGFVGHLVLIPNPEEYREEALCGHRPGRGRRSRWLHLGGDPNCTKCMAIAERRGLEVSTLE